MSFNENFQVLSKPSGTRFMWNDGDHILCSHICKLVNDDQDNGMKLAPRLSQQHINLNPYSVMNVRLAVQTLSSTTAIALRNCYDTETRRTAEFCDMMNSFFDMLNIRNNKEHITKLNSNLKPLTSTDGERLEWRQSAFLEYFVKWNDSINGRSGNFSKRDRENVRRYTHHNTFNDRINTFPLRRRC